MSIVIHTIKGSKYAYDHHRVGDKVKCKYVGLADRKPTDNMRSTRLSNSPNPNDLGGDPWYASQDKLDAYILKSYTRGGLGVRRIQTIFADELDLHPTRREVEKYLRSIGAELRTRTPKKAPISVTDIESENKRLNESLGSTTIERDSAKVRIEQMKDAAINDAKEILRLKEALMDIRDKGRAPTDAEIDALLI